MIIIIEKISQRTGKQDLINFVHSSLKGNLFQKSGHIAYVKLFTYQDKSTEQIKYYGMMLIPSESVANRVIRKLNKRRLLGHLVFVRQYHTRSWRNDPRVNDAKLGVALKDRRKGNRRKSSLEERRQKSSVKKTFLSETYHF